MESKIIHKIKTFKFSNFEEPLNSKPVTIYLPIDIYTDADVEDSQFYKRVIFDTLTALAKYYGWKIEYEEVE